MLSLSAMPAGTLAPMPSQANTPPRPRTLDWTVALALTLIAIVCDNLTLVSGRYSDLLIIAGTSAATALVIAAVTAVRSRHWWAYVLALALACINLAVMFDAARRFLLIVRTWGQ
jgi:hypothetical protein